MFEDSVFVLFKGERDDPSDDDPFLLRLKQTFKNVVRFPVLSFEYINRDKLANKLSATTDYCGLVFTSPRSVKSVQQAVSGNKKIINELKQKLLFCVGPKTATAIRQEFSLEDSIKINGEQAGNANALGELIVSEYGEKIREDCLPLLLPSSTIARDDIKNILDKENIPLEIISSYQTYPDPEVEKNLKKLRESYQKHHFYLIFFSPSGLNTVSSVCGEQFLTREDVRLIALGKTTSEAIRKLGLNIFCIAKNPTADSLCEAIGEKMKPGDQP
ncbi:uroporphyrinogen-III synthase-like [Brevipalpus obovatus]|uniref:uroporphyrinogen-III synthase-like n=1 Tax=Brevipalpus obovatus TaxID=246614 RepID=UPI003D9F56F3